MAWLQGRNQFSQNLWSIAENNPGLEKILQAAEKSYVTSFNQYAGMVDLLFSRPTTNQQLATQLKKCYMR